MADGFGLDMSELEKLAIDISKIDYRGKNKVFWKEIGVTLYEAQGKIFQNEGAYGGHAKWKKGKKKHGKTLVKSGDMRKAIGILSTSDLRLFYGISSGVIPYAEIHQFGWGIIPQREFIFTTRQDEVIFGKIATEHFYNKIRRGIQ